MRTVFVFCALAVICSTSCQTAEGDIFIEMYQIRNDVVVSSSGTIDTTNLELVATRESSGGVIRPAAAGSQNALVLTGPSFSLTSNPLFDAYSNPNLETAVGPSSFGTGVIASPDFGSGDLHGFVADREGDSGSAPSIMVPAGYVSGDSISSSMTYLNTSFADLGVTEGTYTWSFAGNDVTLVIVVPLGLPPILGDCNLDGEVTFSDIPTFIEILSSGTYLLEADCNEDGEVNFADIGSFIAILTSG